MVFKEIKSKLDIVDIIQNYIKLHKVGSNYRARCPFHNEKTASFYVNREKQIYTCFGCQEKGDVFSFVEKIENCTKYESLKTLAKLANVELDSNFKEQTKPLTTTEIACNLYHQVLLKCLETDNAVSDYIKKRKLDINTIKVFKLGFAPSNFLHKYNIHDEALQKDNKDIFSNRLIIPITRNNIVLGFTGRSITDDIKPKYLNTKETTFFKKNDIWFGLDKARSSIISKGYVIIVEGNMDVITAHKHGIKNIIATQGIGFTDEKLKQIANIVNEVHICFDNDNAGIENGIKMYLAFTKLGVDVKKVVLQSKDIDEDLNNGIKSLKTTTFPQEFIDNFAYESISEVKTKIKRFNELVEYLPKVEIELYSNLLSKKLNIKENTIEVKKKDIVLINDELNKKIQFLLNKSKYNWSILNIEKIDFIFDNEYDIELLEKEFIFYIDSKVNDFDFEEYIKFKKQFNTVLTNKWLLQTN